jgi:DNA processing protein
VEAIFRESTGKLIKIPGIGEVMAGRIRDPGILSRAAEELQFIGKNNIRVFFYLDENYPRRFSNCPDAPVLFYMKGNVNLDTDKIISIVGTRSATDYGRQMCDALIRDLASQNDDLLVVSGLAYGIDIQAHKSSLKYGIPTIGVLGHGLDTLYPALHAKVARQMIEKGGLLTDFPSQTKIDPSNFIRRNRLIAGLSDATIVVESGEKGGALITADIAASYDRDVMAFPGRSTDSTSRGCNRLIKSNVAAMIENASDMEYLLGWDSKNKKVQPVQQQLFTDLTVEEETLISLLKNNDRTYIDMLVLQSEIPLNRMAALLLNLEFKGLVESLPGNIYRLR